VIGYFQLAVPSVGYFFRGLYLWQMGIDAWKSGQCAARSGERKELGVF
jgi:hypothetical protein